MMVLEVALGVFFRRSTSLVVGHFRFDSGHVEKANIRHRF